jgi:hypothetical protein
MKEVGFKINYKLKEKGVLFYLSLKKHYSFE